MNMEHPWVVPTEFRGSLLAIDMHTHINSPSPFGNKTDETYTAELNDLLKLNRAAGIEKMFACTFASCLKPETIPEENRFMHELIDREECLYQWVVIDPRIEESFRQAEQMLHHKKCVGIKLHPLYHKYPLMQYFDRIFALASRFHTRILIHPETEASYILPMADKYPEATVIIAHLGSVSYVDAVEQAVHQNIYVDTSGIASSRNLMVEYAYSRIGAEHILFGTDTYAAGFQRGRIEYALIPEKEKEKILRYNAEQLFSDCL